MTRAFQIGLIAASLIAMLAAGIRADQKTDETAARSVALNWLQEIDEHQYRQAWGETATLFKSAVNADQFATAMDTARTRLGAVISRKLLTEKYATALPGAPPGQYVVVVFATDFAGQRHAKEVITPMLEKDGKWRVSGYYIR